MLTSIPAEPNFSVEETVDILPDDLFGMLEPEPEETEEETQEVEAVVEEAEEEEQEEESEEEQEEESEEEAEEETQEVETTDETEETDKLYDVQIGEDVYEVNLEELKHGYLRGEDYMRKVNEFESNKEKWEQEAAQERAAAYSQLEDIRREFAVNGSAFEQVNWDHLKATNPQEYVVKRAQYAEFIEQRGKLEAQRVALQKLEEKHNELQARAYLQKQSDLVQQLIPEWKDEKTRVQLQKAIAEYGLQQGLSQEEINSLSDARVLSLLNKARLYDEGLKKRKEVAQKKVPKEVTQAIKPGVSTDNSAPKGKRIKEAAARFKDSGSLHDAASYLDAIGFELPTLK